MQSINLSYQNLPFHLNEEQISNPMEVLTNFTETKTLSEQRQAVQELLCFSLGGSTADSITGKEAGEMVFFCREITEIIEAIYVIAGKANTSTEN